MAASGGYNYPGGNNQDNSWLGCVFILVLAFVSLIAVIVRIIVSL